MTEKQIHTKDGFLSFLTDLLFPRVGGESRGEQVFFTATAAVTAYFLSATPLFFGACPFGLAYIAARRHRVFPVFVGLSVGFLVADAAISPVYIALFSAVFLLRFLFSYPRGDVRRAPVLFSETPALRVTAGAVGGFLAGAYELFVGGTTGESLFYARSMSLSVPILTFLYLPLVEYDATVPELLGKQKVELTERLAIYGKAAPAFLLVSVAAFGASITLSLRELSLFGFSFSVLFAAASTFAVAKRKGALWGAFYAAAVALATGGATVLAFTACGFLSGLLFPYGTFYALAAGTVASGILLALAGGLPLFLEALPETAAAALLSAPFYSGAFRKDKSAPAACDTKIYYAKNADLRRNERLSHALLELSATFRNMGTYMNTPDRAAVQTLVRAAARERCSICEKHTDCLYKDSPERKTALLRVSDRLCAGERDIVSALAPKENADCAYTETLSSDVLTAFAEKEKSRGDSASERFAADYETLGKILSEAEETDRKERAEDTRLSGELLSALEAAGGFRGSVTVFGVRQKEILLCGSQWDGRRLSAEEIRTLFEELCVCRLSEPQIDLSNGQMTMRMHVTRKFDAEFVSGTLPGGAEPSGDVTRHFENEENVFYALLSDGMGSGKTARVTAELSGVFLSEFLSAGVRAETALRTLNAVIREKGTECSSTVDLFELDLLYGKAAFYKSGAATSYVRRGKDVFRIRSKTMPVGLLREIDAEKIRFDVQAGDVIILLSDGVSQTPEDAPWLLSLLSDGFDANLPTMAEKITTAARAAGRTDDMTVALVRIAAPKKVL